MFWHEKGSESIQYNLKYSVFFTRYCLDCLKKIREIEVCTFVHEHVDRSKAYFCNNFASAYSLFWLMSALLAYSKALMKKQRIKHHSFI